MIDKRLTVHWIGAAFDAMIQRVTLAACIDAKRATRKTISRVVKRHAHRVAHCPGEDFELGSIGPATHDERVVPRVKHRPAGALNVVLKPSHREVQTAIATQRTAVHVVRHSAKWKTGEKHFALIC